MSAGPGLRTPGSSRHRAALASPRARERTDHLPWRQTRLALGLGLGVVLLLLCLLLSLGFGASHIPPATVISALLDFDGSVEHLTVRSLRLPRALIAVAVGGALALAGAVMQGITRNPLASPGILGLNAGAALAVVAATYLWGLQSAAAAAGLAFAGAGATAVTVYLLGSVGRDGLASVRLVIAGAAITALLGSLTTAILIFDQQTLEQIRFWLAGSVAGRDLALLLRLLPYLLLGFGIAMVLAKQITTLTLGESVARGLGQRTLRVHLGAALAVTLLAGGSVAIAGPIAFVGLIVPNAVRSLVGVDYRWILPYSAVVGAVLLLVADVAARLVARPVEVPVGVMTAVIGGPVLIHLARRQAAR